MKILNNLGSGKTPFVIIGVLMVLCVCLMCCVLAFVLLISTFSSQISFNMPFASDVMPSYYGVFVRQGNSLIELPEGRAMSVPVESRAEEVEIINSSKPVIVIWKDNLSLEYLVIYKLGKKTGQQIEINYTATPKDGGIVEIAFSRELADGIYCLLFGDPFATFIPTYCFQIGAVSP
jgi:hypothetical protein